MVEGCLMPIAQCTYKNKLGNLHRIHNSYFVATLDDVHIFVFIGFSLRKTNFVVVVVGW